MFLVQLSTSESLILIRLFPVDTWQKLNQQMILIRRPDCQMSVLTETLRRKLFCQILLLDILQVSDALLLKKSQAQ